MPSDLSDDHQLCLRLLNAPTSPGNFPLPGVTEVSTKKLVKKLQENYIHNNAFFGGTIFHNHVMDHLFAMWSIGASAEALEEVYVTHDYEDPVKPSPEPITDSNFVEHLGDANFYSAYTTFFCRALAKDSVADVLDRFVFSPAYNVNPNLPHDKKALKDGEKHPEMLGRFMAGVLHPMIHVGYGAEFGVVQQVAEGLAQTAIHPDYQTPTTPLYLFTTADKYGRGLSRLELPSRNAGPPPLLSFHQVLATDPRFTPAALGFKRPVDGDSIEGGVSYFKTIQNTGPTVMELVNEWYDRWIVGVPEGELEDRLEKMVEDVIVGNVYWYTVSGYAARGKSVFNAEFITMHFVTSAIFLPTLALLPGRTRANTLNPPLPLSSRLLLVRDYLASCAIWYLARYRPSSANMSIPALYAATNSRLSLPRASHAYAPGQAPKREFIENHQKTVPFGASAWLRVVQNAAVHPNEHLIKLVRALGAFDLLYGARSAGAYAGVDKVLDGTIFLRSAVLTMDRLGWAYEEEPLALWDRHGYYDAVEGDDGM
ncbi:hypothetical protein K488DRAFT_89369 [Vararia minispora EC-137]|uniref:Uncharacterized protein n=1 Tax=Vararia minispora EC-137 TaxID=1314806 RepID=A0ACB8QC02_9AGAM|nr:hypothetical protein K488DRAFT_89369 [Vararia minispora EC-137]